MSGSQAWVLSGGTPAATRARRRRGAAPGGRFFQGRVTRPVLIWWRRARAALGIRRGVRVDGFYYKELTPESLQRALSRRSRGSKKYRVTFPDGAKLVIRCSPECVYADLMGPLGLQRYQCAAARLSPGKRVLEIGSGTGYRAAWISQMVGPSGAVVAIEQDATQSEYASRRYPCRNVAYECAGLEALVGETDGAFDAALSLSLPTDEARARASVAEMWRVLTPGGTLLVGADAAGEAVVRAIAEELAASTAAALVAHGGAGEPREFLLTKPIA